MTKKHAILVLDSLSTWLGYERPITEEIVEAIKTLSQHSLPSDRDEAAKEYAKTTFKKPYSDNPDEEVTIVEPDKYAGFIAGARYEDEKLSEKIAAAYQLGLADKEKQMMSEAVEGKVRGRVYDHINVRFADGICKFLSHIPADVSKYKVGDKVRVIVCKKED